MNAPGPNPIDAITESLLASYDLDETTQRIGQEFLPDREVIVSALREIQQLLFPGFFGQKALTAENLRYHVGSLLTRLDEQLADQIRHCMCLEKGCTCDDPTACQVTARAIARKFLAALPKLREKLSHDAQAAFDGDPAATSIDEIIYCYPGFYAVMVHRIAHELLELGVALMPRIMAEHAHSLTGCDIHPGAEIGKSFFIDHSTGVVIGQTSRIGDNVKIYQGVTLGAKSFPKDERGRAIKGLQRHPTIEDNVTIYANATILGGDTVIGQGVTVGGNVFVTESIDERSTVSHKPPRLQVRSKSTPPKAKKSKP